MQGVCELRLGTRVSEERWGPSKPADKIRSQAFTAQFPAGLAHGVEQACGQNPALRHGPDTQALNPCQAHACVLLAAKDALKVHTADPVS